MDFAAMSPDDVQAEAARRAERKRRGLPLHETPGEVAEYTVQRIAENDDRMEKQIQSDVRKLYIAFGCTVYSLSQARASKQSPGLGDLYVIHRRLRVAFWHETKTPSGNQSAPQRDFEEWNRDADVTVVVGGLVAAGGQLIKIGAAERIGGRIEPKR